MESIYTSTISVVASELLKVLLKNGRGKEEKPLQKEKKISRICWGSKTSYEWEGSISVGPNQNPGTQTPNQAKVSESSEDSSPVGTSRRKLSQHGYRDTGDLSKESEASISQHNTSYIIHVSLTVYIVYIL